MASPPPEPLARVDRVLAPVTWLVAAFAVVVLFAGPQLIGAERAPGSPPPAAYPGSASGSGSGSGSGPSGEAVFASAGCGGCHTFAAAGASGTVGPDLDALKPDTGTVAETVKSGRGAMPAFADELSVDEIDAVAKYVADNAGG